MAVQIVPAKVAHYMGLSSDPKPAFAVNGSTFHTVNTGETYIYFDGGWHDDLRLFNIVKLGVRAADMASIEGAANVAASTI